MPSANDRPDLQPQGKRGVLRAYGLALLIHLLLAAALTWGVSWKSQDKDASFSAELWSALPQEAAPPLAETPPETPNTPPTPPQPPAAPPVPVAPSPSQLQAQADAEIALAREKRKREEAEVAQKAQLAEKAKQEQAKADKAKQDKAKAEKEKTEKENAEAKRKADASAQAKAAKEAKDAEAKRQAQAEAKQQAAAEKLRKDNIARMMGMAGGTGAADSKGTAAQASGPSASYAGRVRARIKPNVVFTDDIVGNPVAEVEVRTSLDGTIISQRLVKSSGNKDWDEAVIKAIIRTEVLPRDVDGRVPSPLIISFRPKD